MYYSINLVDTGWRMHLWYRGYTKNMRSESNMIWWKKDHKWKIATMKFILSFFNYKKKNVVTALLVPGAAPMLLVSTKRRSHASFFAWDRRTSLGSYLFPQKTNNSLVIMIAWRKIFWNILCKDFLEKRGMPRLEARLKNSLVTRQT